MKQQEFTFWNKVIDPKLAEAKAQRIEKRNEWIRKNLQRTYIEDKFDEPNLRGI